MENKTKKTSALLAFEKFAAAIAAAFLPCAVYWLAHVEATAATLSDWQLALVWSIVVAGLAYSAPSVTQWANGWTRNLAKSIGFTVLLEGVLVFSATSWLNLSALAILSGINCLVAVAAMRNRSTAFAVTRAKRKPAKRKAAATVATA